MADQNYGDAQQAVQVFYAASASPGVNLVPVLDSSTTGRHASLVAGSNRYTVTSIAFAVTSATFTGSSSSAYSISKSASAAGDTVALGNIKLPSMSKGDVARCQVALDLLPGEVCFLTSYGNGAGDLSITFDGYTSNFAPTEGEVEKPSGSKVINLPAIGGA